MYKVNKDDGAYEFIAECEGCGKVTALEPEAHLCIDCISDCDNTDINTDPSLIAGRDPADVRSDMNYELLCEKYFD